MPRRVLVTGASGQLGRELQRTAPNALEVVALSRSQCDIADLDQLKSAVQRHGVDVIVNAAAYTQVDKAESDRDHAFSVNATAVENLSIVADREGIKLIHVSTDFVFDGETTRLYTPEDSPDPQSTYGESKWKGERHIQNILGDKGIIVRTGWLYSAYGNNFVKTMLRLMGEKEQLGVVADQFGTPTWAKGLAECCWGLVLSRDACGVYHWSDNGICSWYDFAVEIQRVAYSKGLLDKRIPINKISTEEYPTLAKRPKYSALSNAKAVDELGIISQDWPFQLTTMMSELQV